MSRSKAIQLARSEKHHMLTGPSANPSDQENFASDAISPAEGHGYAGVVGFKGKDGTTLVALIDEDCYVSWSEQ